VFVGIWRILLINFFFINGYDIFMRWFVSTIVEVEYLDIIVGAIPAVLDIKVQEGEIHEMIAVDFQQPLAILSVRIIFRIIGRVNDARARCESTTALDGNDSVARVESSTSLREVRVELYEHLVARAGVHHWLVRVTELDQFRRIRVLAAVNLDFVEGTALALLGVHLKEKSLYFYTAASSQSTRSYLRKLARLSLHSFSDVLTS